MNAGVVAFVSVRSITCHDRHHATARDTFASCREGLERNERGEARGISRVVLEKGHHERSCPSRLGPLSFSPGVHESRPAAHVVFPPPARGFCIYVCSMYTLWLYEISRVGRRAAVLRINSATGHDRAIRTVSRAFAGFPSAVPATSKCWYSRSHVLIVLPLTVPLRVTGPCPSARPPPE